jgi:hypothetical protein
METTKIANRLVELCRKGEFVQAEQELYGADIVHIEVDGKEFKGFDEVLQKEVQFLAGVTSPITIEVSEPLVASSYFSIRMHIQCEHNQRGTMDMDELLMYKVADGKIVHLKCYL